MKMKQKILITIILSLAAVFTLQLNAQDIHFSQFYQAPQQLNPGLTGHMLGKYRFNANYRRQWAQISGRPVYETPAIGFDMNILGKKDHPNTLGLGIILMNDQSSGGILQTFNLAISAAYHIDLTNNSKNYLSFGLQGGVINKRLRSNEVGFASQFNHTTHEIDLTMSSGEMFGSNSIYQPDLRFGIVFAAFPNTRTRFKIGGGAYHLSQAKESFVQELTTVPMRFVGHADARFKLSDKLALEPKILYQNQANASELVGGLLFDILIAPKSKTSLYLGGEYRLGDAAIAIAGLRLFDTDIGVSYDFNLSDLKTASQGNGALEFSLIKMFRRAVEPVDPILPAIRYN